MNFVSRSHAQYAAFMPIIFEEKHERQIRENHSSCMTHKKWLNNKSVRNAQNHNNNANYAWANFECVGTVCPLPIVPVIVHWLARKYFTIK